MGHLRALVPYGICGRLRKETNCKQLQLNRMGHQLSRESDQMVMKPDTGTIYLRVDLEDPQHPEPCTNAKHPTCVRFVDETPVTHRKTVTQQNNPRWHRVRPTRNLAVSIHRKYIADVSGHFRSRFV